VCMPKKTGTVKMIRPRTRHCTRTLHTVLIHYTLYSYTTHCTRTLHTITYTLHTITHTLHTITHTLCLYTCRYWTRGEQGGLWQGAQDRAGWQ
jgi:hypothetical protein